MNEFLVILLCLALSLFIFFQVHGFIRDLKKRREEKRLSEEKLKEAEQKNGVTYEQSADTKADR